MMVAVPPKSRATLILEFVFAACVVGSFIRVISFLFSAGYLPPPFFYAVDDTFMDWFNTAYFSNNSGAYDIWRTIYPPLSFVFLRIFSIHGCYQESELYSRDCDWLGRFTLVTFYALNAILVYKAYRISDPRTAIPRAIAMVVGLPMLFALDRGNLIVPCFAFFTLAHSGILRSARLRWIALALTINFKPYLILTILPNVIRRRWRAFEGCVVAGILIYLLTYSLLGEGTPFDMLSNMLNYTVKDMASYVENAFYGASYSSIVGMLRSEFPMIATIGSRPVELLTFIFPIFILIGQIGVALCFAGAALRPGTVPMRRLTALGVIVVMSSVEVGGYAEVFFLFLVFFERWKGAGSIMALVAGYLLCISVDMPVVHVAREVRDSYLTNRTVGYDVGVYAGELIRPGLILLIEYGLVAASLMDVARVWRTNRRVRGDLIAERA